jgi:hypothetical protein
MSDRETQEAINETLREIVDRLDEKWKQERRKRELSQDRHFRCYHWMLLGDENFCCEGKIQTYFHAKKIVREYIEHLPLPKE